MNVSVFLFAKNDHSFFADALSHFDLHLFSPLKGISASGLMKKQSSDSDLLGAMSAVTLSNNVNGESVNGVYSRRTSTTLSPMRSLRTVSYQCTFCSWRS